MPTTPLVSIVTPSYNQAAFLEYAIRSVLAQQAPDSDKLESDPPFRLEYIIVDGASTDTSRQIIERYQDYLAWWVAEADTGQADAINKGFTRARGEYVGWLNSDDLYLPGAIAGAVKAFQAHPQAGFVYGDALAIDVRGTPINRFRFAQYSLTDLLGFRILCQPAIFLRREILERAGFLDDSYHFLLDHQLWIKIAGLAPIHYEPSIWAAARQHPQAKNVAQAQRFGSEARRIFDWMDSQTDLQPLLQPRRARIQAGMHRLTARYLLDGGQYSASLVAYLAAIRADPRFAFQHWHRMLFAGLSMLGGKRLESAYFAYQRRRRAKSLQFAELANWPGIQPYG